MLGFNFRQRQAPAEDAAKRLGGGSKLLGFPLHVHMLRHACGYKLANDGHDTRLIQDYLGHKSIMSTVRYTELTATKFKNVWR
jgi:site-specific recombinase XerD